MKPEIVRRSSLTDAVESLFRQTPHVWISWQALAAVGGSCGWRTRCAECRKRFKADGGMLVWNGSVRASAYMFRPATPLGRDAGSFTPQPRLWS